MSRHDRFPLWIGYRMVTGELIVLEVVHGQSHKVKGDLAVITGPVEACCEHHAKLKIMEEERIN